MPGTLNRVEKLYYNTNFAVGDILIGDSFVKSCLQMYTQSDSSVIGLPRDVATCHAHATHNRKRYLFLKYAS